MSTVSVVLVAIFVICMAMAIQGRIKSAKAVAGSTPPNERGLPH